MPHCHITTSHHILTYKTTMDDIHTPLQMLSQQSNSHPLPTAILLTATSAIYPIKKTIKSIAYSQFYSIFGLQFSIKIPLTRPTHDWSYLLTQVTFFPIATASCRPTLVPLLDIKKGKSPSCIDGSFTHSCLTF